MSHLGGGDETLSLAVERLEGLHEVGEGSGVRLPGDRLVDGQDLLELVLLLACNWAAQNTAHNSGTQSEASKETPGETQQAPHDEHVIGFM